MTDQAGRGVNLRVQRTSDGLACVEFVRYVTVPFDRLPLDMEAPLVQFRDLTAGFQLPVEEDEANPQLALIPGDAA